MRPQRVKIDLAEIDIRAGVVRVAGLANYVTPAGYRNVKQLFDAAHDIADIRFWLRFAYLSRHHHEKGHAAAEFVGAGIGKNRLKEQGYHTGKREEFSLSFVVP